jgi:threonine dehydratase
MPARRRCIIATGLTRLQTSCIVKSVTPPPEIAQIEAARTRITPYVKRTPVLTSASLDSAAGARLHFKCENFQKSGSFKARGAFNAIMSLPDDASAVVTHSSGNHAAAVALAARTRSLAAHIVMPHTAPHAKRHAVESYGARLTPCEPTLAAREAEAKRLVAETGGVFVAPFDSTEVVAGQGTLFLEFLEDVGEPLDMVIVPVGGGGLLAGTALAAASRSPHTAIIGVEPAAADDAARGFRAGMLQPQVVPVATIADGVTTAMSEMTFSVMSWLVSDVVTVSEAGIVEAMKLIWSRLKIVVEPSCALPLAAVLEGAVNVRGKSVGIVLTGGNVDLERLPWQR